MKIIIRKNGGRDDAVIETDTGAQHFDFSGLDRPQHDGARELIVDAWAVAHGFPKVYGHD